MRRTVRRGTVAASLSALCLLAGFPMTPAAQQAPAPTPPQVFRGGTDAVLVDVYPHRNGRIVEGLTAADFQVFEDGRAQRIETFEFVRLDPVSAGPRADPNTIPEMRAAAADPHNRVFVVYLDNGHTTVQGGIYIRRPLVDMLERAVGPSDLFGVMTPDMRPTNLALGRLTTSIDEQLGKSWAWGTRNRLVNDWADPMEEQLSSCFHQKQTADKTEDWLVRDGPVVRFLDEILIERRRELRTLTSLQELISYLGALREARSVVVAVTDGWVLFDQNQALTNEPPKDVRFSEILQTGPVDRRSTRNSGINAVAPEFGECVQELNRLAAHNGGQEFRALVSLANRNNVSFYPVASAGLTAGDAAITDAERRAPNALPTDVGLRDASRMNARTMNNQSLAESTDGLAVVNTNDLAAGLRRVADDVSAYYLLSYVSDKAAPDNRFRKIDVKVKGEGLTVRARRGYTARERAVVKATPGPPAIAAGITTAIARLTTVRPGSELVAYGAVAGGDVRIAVELRGPSATTQWPAGTTVSATVTADNGATVTTTTAPLDTAWRNAWLSFPVPSAPGPWRVTLSVGTGRDRLQDQIVVDQSTGSSLGDPVISRTRPAVRSPLRPAATFQFARSERLHIEWTTRSAIDVKEARLLDVKGQALPVPVTLTDVAQPNGIAADLTLSPLAPGDYVIELSTSAGTTTTRHYVAFRVTP